MDYQMRAIHFLNDGNEILFRSERTGWGHYYLYDKDGNLKNQVTSGPWVAGPIQKIDTAKRQIYFVGLRALRIFGFADDDVDADIAAGEPVHNFDCRRFVFINGDYRFLDAERPV